ncbi:hypothetical protein D3C72_1485050 [compost metagenome]
MGQIAGPDLPESRRDSNCKAVLSRRHQSQRRRSRPGFVHNHPIEQAITTDRFYHRMVQIAATRKRSIAGQKGEQRHDGARRRAGLDQSRIQRPAFRPANEQSPEGPTIK